MRKITTKLAAIIITFSIGTSASLLLDNLNVAEDTSLTSKVENMRNAVPPPPMIYSQVDINGGVSRRVIAEVIVSENGMVISPNTLRNSPRLRQAVIVPADKSRFNPTPLSSSRDKVIRLRGAVPYVFNLH